MKKLFSFLFITSGLFAQNEPTLLFSNAENNVNYGGAISTALSTKDIFGNTYLVGTFSNIADFDPSAAADNITSIGSSDLFVAVYDSNGAYIATRNLGGSGTIIPTAVAIGGGFIYLAGTYSNTIDFDPSAAVANLTSANTNGSNFLAKYDLNGTFITCKSINGSGKLAINDMKFLNNEIAIAGDFTESMDLDPSAAALTLTSNGAKDAFIAKYDSSLLLQTAISFGGTGDDTASSLAFDAAAAIFISGSYNNTVDFDPSASTTSLTTTEALTSHTFIAKYTNTGLFLWVKNVGGRTNTGNSGAKLVLDSSANILVTGTYNQISDFDPSAAVANLSASNSDIFIAKYNSTGTYLWAKRIGSTSNDISRNISIDTSNNIYIYGTFLGTVNFDPNAEFANLSSSTGTNFFAKYDVNGIYIYARNLFATITTLLVDNSNALMLSGVFSGTRDFDHSAGTANLTSVSSNVFLAKYASDSAFVFAKQIGGDAPSNAVANFIATDATGAIYRVGSLSATTDLDPSAAVFNVSSPSAPGLFIAKYTSSGGFVWGKSISAVVSSSLILSIMNTDSNGNTYIIGRFIGTVDFDPSANTANLTSNNGTTFDVFMAKYDSNGNYMWAKQLSGSFFAGAKRMLFDTSGNFYFTGRLSGSTPIDFDPSPTSGLYAPVASIEVFFAKYSPSGDFIWVNGIIGLDSGSAMNETHFDLKGNSLYLSGVFLGSFKFSPTTNDVVTSNGALAGFVAKYDLNGNYQFGAAVDNGTEISTNAVQNVVADDDNNFYLFASLSGSADFDLLPNTTSTITSPSSEGNSITSFIVSKYAPTGSLLWAKSLDQSSMDTGISQNTVHSYVHNNELILSFPYFGAPNSGIDLDPSSTTNIVYTNSSSANLIIAKYNTTTGNLIWGNKIEGAYNATLNSTNFDSNASLLLSGSFTGTADFNLSSGVQNITSASPYNSDRFWAKYGVTALGIEEVTTTQGYIIYPNPTNATLYVSHANYDTFKITLMDLTGKILQKATLTNQKGVDVSAFPSGMYFIQIENGFDKNTYKFIKN